MSLEQTADDTREWYLARDIPRTVLLDIAAFEIGQIGCRVEVVDRENGKQTYAREFSRSCSTMTE